MALKGVYFSLVQAQTFVDDDDVENESASGLTQRRNTEGDDGFREEAAPVDEKDKTETGADTMQTKNSTKNEEEPPKMTTAQLLVRIARITRPEWSLVLLGLFCKFPSDRVWG